MWSFGDGTRKVTASPKIMHTYGKTGKYKVTLRVIDQEGCSSQLVFTGQTAYCNGSGRAIKTVRITVGS